MWHRACGLAKRADAAQGRGMHGFRRHVLACNNARLPGRRLTFRIGGDVVGYVTAELARALTFWPQHIHFDGGGLSIRGGRHAAALQGIAQDLSERGYFRWRDEAFDVRAHPGGPVLARIDRGALPAFGILAEGVHLNGLVRRAEGVHLWVGRRAPHKTLDPDKLDHIVAGGVPAGLTPVETLAKEGDEEAGLPAELAVRAEKVGEIGYAMEREEGLRRDLLHCFDLWLPEDFTPHPNDHEVVAFELWPLARVHDSVRDTDMFKFNVNLVLIDLFIRQGLIVGTEAEWLRQALNAE